MQFFKKGMINLPEERNTGRLVAELVLDTSKARKEAEAVKKYLILII